jgi:hypothetical protein
MQVVRCAFLFRISYSLASVLRGEGWGEGLAPQMDAPLARLPSLRVGL